MEWYNYPAAFFAGIFLANAIPHFVHGISGNRFPTPFAKPRGVGLSPPTTNVVWALVNLLASYFLCRVGKVNEDHEWSLLVFFAGIVAMSIFLSIRFTKKRKE